MTEETKEITLEDVKLSKEEQKAWDSYEDLKKMASALKIEYRKFDTVEEYEKFIEEALADFGTKAKPEDKIRYMEAKLKIAAFIDIERERKHQEELNKECAKFWTEKEMYEYCQRISEQNKTLFHELGILNTNNKAMVDAIAKRDDLLSQIDNSSELIKEEDGYSYYSYKVKTPEKETIN